MSDTKEMRGAREVAKEILTSGYQMHEEVERIQADALAWAAGQIEQSHSLQEALLRLSLKHQELTKRQTAK